MMLMSKVSFEYIILFYFIFYRKPTSINNLIHIESVLPAKSFLCFIFYSSHKYQAKYHANSKETSLLSNLIPIYWVTEQILRSNLILFVIKKWKETKKDEWHNNRMNWKDKVHSTTIMIFKLPWLPVNDHLLTYHFTYI